VRIDTTVAGGPGARWPQGGDRATSVHRRPGTVAHAGSKS